MNAFRRGLTMILNGFGGLSFLAMVVLTCWQVVTRYILKAPSAWSEELVSYLFAWMSLCGACLVTEERGHMNIPVLAERAGPRMKQVLLIFGEGIAVIFSAVILLYGGWKITGLAMGQMTSSLGVAVGVFYLVLPLAGAANIIYGLMNITGLVTEGGKEDTWPLEH